MPSVNDPLQKLEDIDVFRRCERPWEDDPEGRSEASAVGAERAGRSGLVTCAITSREDLTVGSLWGPRFPAGDLVGLAGDLLRSEKECARGPRAAHQVVISPGSVQLKRRYVTALDLQALEKCSADREEAESLLFGEEADTDREVPLRGMVGSWSSKSRANMVRRLVTLDYSAWMIPGQLPALVTLTLPGGWQDLAPDGARFMKLLQTWRKRYERAWGPLQAIWKREFQRRGAPHFHLLMVPPQGRTETGEVFHTWLSRTWAEVCGAEGEEYQKHLRAGTGIDYAEAVTMRDPKRLAIYFLKKESAASGASSKEYQHRVPEFWAGKTVGRWWGYWGLRPLTHEVELTPQEWITVARTLRRYSRAQGRTKKVTRTRRVLDPETGEVRRSITRRTTVRQYFFRGSGSGFLCVNDGPVLAEFLARLLGPERISLNPPRLTRTEWFRLSLTGVA